ncbi:hypothetical protein VTO42DRAFT_5863 [Malbranchea cinnamomea]
MESQKPVGDKTGRTQQSLRRAHTVTQTGNLSQQSPARRTGRLRTTSLRRTDNRNESTRRGLQESPTSPREGTGPRSVGREGRYFTVGNVGHNGKIYLRPIANQPRPRNDTPGFRQPASLTPVLTELTPNTVDDESRLSIWSSSQRSDLRPPPIREDSAESRLALRQNVPIPNTRESPPSRSPGELKIAIDRPGQESMDDSSARSTAPEMSTLHSRLGESGFGEDDAPSHSSVHARSSETDSLRRSLTRYDASVSIRGRSNDQPTQSFVLPVFPVSRSFNGLAKASNQSAVFYKLKEPIEPSIFDTLLSQMDDPSVVRYLKGTNQITAATPARIVAQISSDSFMDYELVSDFFLTFRSYLSLSNLLSLLLARLEWAIDRLEDDGRIIRIRVFAALRHWILNYFVDDFVPNRNLRVQFCDRINKLYDEVKNRNGDRASDLKILIDLKRCWNGRCSMYWDSPEFLTETHPDNDVLPGDNDEPDWSYFQPQYQESAAQAPNARPNQAIPLEASARVAPQSPQSPGAQGGGLAPSPSGISGQVISCSLPPRISTHETLHSSKPRGRYPVPVTPRKLSAPLAGPQAPVSPIWHRALNAHKRSGSFTDSFRDDRAPLPIFDGHPQLNLNCAECPESVIRGNVYGPLEAQVIVGPPSPAFEVNHLKFPPETSAVRPGGPAKGSDSTGKKNFIESIRKVLHSRQGGSQGGGQTSLQWTRGRTSTLPPNVALGSEIHRNRRGGSHGRGHPRLDRLGEAALHSYRELLVRVSRNSQYSTESAAGGRPTKTMTAVRSSLGVPSEQHIPRQTSTGSQPIVVVDDTGIGASLMSGAPQSSMLVEGSQRDDSPGPADGHSYSPNRRSDLVAGPGSETGSQHSEQPPLTESQRSTDFSPYSVHRSSSLPRESPRKPTRSLSERLRKYTSYHSNWGMRSSSPESHSTRRPLSRSSSLHRSLKPIARMLRRRPGGDLRKMQLAGHLHARHSMASFASGTTNAGSGQDSLLYMSGMERERDSRYASLPARKPYSLIQEPSSQHLRPSFEAAIARFARIPDDDDGGVESALLKLEGKWVPKSPSPAEYSRPSMESRLRYVENCENEPGPSHQQHQSALAHHGMQDTHVVVAMDRTDSYVESESSYCSIPLLERGLTDHPMKRPKHSHAETKAPGSSLQSNEQPASSDRERSHPSIEVVEKTQSMKQIPQGSSLPDRHTPPPASHGRTDENEMDTGISEISSEISVEIIDGAEVPGSGLSPLIKFSSLGVPPHPLVHHPSPPKNVQSLDVMTSHPYSARTTSNDPQPLSPDSSRTARDQASGSGASHGRSQSCGPGYSLDIEQPSSPFSNHVPFILAHDSRTLAQQFTLVEQAALSEIDWRDLVEMRWSQSSQSTLNWVEYLAEEERKGIDIVVARFNLMVKWAVSEIVLTKDIHERAQVITKLIHIAVHARNLCNYATMLQITIALSSVDCTRLVKTWELVPEGEKRLLKDMEPLVQPVRNFHRLRMEMENSTLQNGCIPFVGLYVQDLTYNSQKPAQIASTRDGEPLVNFERYRTAAAIVKSLLRLIDASTKYAFEPVHGVVERCLWITALPDEEIMALSKSLE